MGFLRRPSYGQSYQRTKVPLKPSVFWLMIFLTLVFSNVMGQSSDTKMKLKPFHNVSAEFREELISRFRTFLAYKRNEDFRHLYEMLTPFFRSGNPESQFVKDYEYYYSGNDGFISFTPSSVGETVSPFDKRPDVWFIEGCLTERVNAKKRSMKVIFEASRGIVQGKENIFFTDATTQPVSMGPNKKCRP
jgi:hypothetical protein